MKVLFKNLDLNREYDRMYVTHYLWCVTIFFTRIYEYRLGVNEFSFLSFLFLILILVFFKAHIKTMKNFYYTYWTFSAIAFTYATIKFFYFSFANNLPQFVWLYLFSMMLMGIEFYQISSPLFFPRVRWWEYDFRYRADLKVTAIEDEEKYKARLTDLRRGAGCIVMFDDIASQEILQLKLDWEDDTFEVPVKIYSKTIGTLGRGITYGVKFVAQTDKEQSDYLSILNIWKDMKKAKLRRKFQESH